MSLKREWSARLEWWRKELPNHFFEPLGEVAVSGFTTFEQLTPSEAREREFRPMPPGTAWGAKWEYAWFQGEFTLPEAAAGGRVELAWGAFGPGEGWNVHGHSVAWIDGEHVGAIDRHHRHLLVAREGVPGQRFEFLIESYAGHGPTPSRTGPVPPEREPIPEPGATQSRVPVCTIGLWNEAAYQLYMDVETLVKLRGNLNENSLRVAEIDAGLKEFTRIVEFEAPREARQASFQAARERLRPLLECTNGSTTPTMYCFGHAHIDTAWLWPLQETERKCARTFSTALGLMEEYPEYKFLVSQPHQYRMVQQRYPELYARIKEAVARGQFIPEGGMWIEADTNISSGESLIRQFLHGKRFFREEFGVDNQMLWLPDVFGYSGALPQIMKGCGIPYFSTAKIFWAYYGGEPFPYNTFWWEGIDGTAVLAHFCNDYNSQSGPDANIRRWEQRVQKDGISARMFPYGWGDGGGGATRDHLEYIRRQADLEGAPKMRQASPIEFFEDLEKGVIPEARYVGELYFQAHRGTFTSQAKTKLGNRKCEFALREAELWSVAARALHGFQIPTAELDEAWKVVLLNQFHDIIPGSSIARVYEEAEASYAEVLETANGVTRQAAASLAEGTEGATLFNSLSWARTALVELPAGLPGVADPHGQARPVQRVEGRVYTEVELPACGWTSLAAAAPVEADNTLSATANSLENELLRLELNDRGEIIRLLDKETGRELAAGPCNQFRMYQDIPANYDAWDIDSMYAENPVELPDTAVLEVVAEGPLVAILRVTRRLNQSEMTQEIRLRRGSRRVDFHTVIDWQERHKLLKVAFPVTYHCEDAIHEIQFGHLRRPTHQSRPYDADRFEVPAIKWSALAEEGRGFAVLNDSKYGLNVSGNSLNLTLLKAPTAPDPRADVGRQEFVYSAYFWNGPFLESHVIREAYELNTCVPVASGTAGERSLFQVDAPNVIVETVKPAEDGSSDIVVRLYEAKRTTTRCTLETTLPVTSAAQTNMLEEVEGELPAHGGRIELEFRPFEVKTVRLRL